MKGLYIGRFQPLHLGHLAAIREARQLGLEELIIGIGDAQKGRTNRNPFTYDEVLHMWLPIADELDISTRIYRLPDIGDPAGYAQHVEQITASSEYDTIVISGNPHTQACFRDYNRQYAIYHPRQSIPLDQGYLCATKIREWMQEGGPWQSYVPHSTQQIVNDVMNQIDAMNQVMEVKLCSTQ